MEDITLLKYIGMNPVLVHGGGPDINKALEIYNIKSEFVNGLRVTDSQTIKVAQMVLVGQTNKEIVSMLNRKGAKPLDYVELTEILLNASSIKPKLMVK